MPAAQITKIAAAAAANVGMGAVFIPKPGVHVAMDVDNFAGLILLKF
jgi:hypothetical protein